MSKTWLALIGVAVLTLIIVTGYEIYQSVNGLDQEFSKTLPGGVIGTDLGVKQLKFLASLKQYVLVDDTSLNTPTPTPTVIIPTVTPSL